MTAITQNGVLKRDDNDQPVMGGTSSSNNATIINASFDPVTRRLLTDSAVGSGTVTSVSVASANGFAGTVANATTTPAITISTTINSPVLAGNGTAIAAATTTGTGSTVMLNAGPTVSTTMTIGTAASTTGAILFKGLTSGTVTLSVADAAGTWTMKLPTSAGANTNLLQTDGSGNLSWVAAPAASLVVGTTTISSGTTTRILYDNAGVLGEYTLTGTGTVVVMATSPTLVTPVLGVATATTINKVTLTAPATGSTLTIADGKTATHNASTTFAGTDGKTLTISNSGTLAGGDAFVLAIAAGKTLTVSNTLTFTGADASSVAFGTGGTVLYTASTVPLTVGNTTIASGTTTRILYDNAGVLGEYTLTGTGTVAVMQTSPSLITPALGVATATSVNGLIITTTTGTITMTNGKTLTVSDSTTLATNAITLGGGEVITFSASNALSLLTTGTTVMTFPAATDTVVTLAASQTLTSKTLTSPIIQTAPVLAAATNLKFTVPSSDVTGTGITTNEFNSGYSSTAIGDLVYLDSSATWQKADADASSATYTSLLGIALSVTASASPATVLLQGFVYAASPFPTFTIGAPIYMSATAGAVTQTAPTTTDSATRVVGYGVHADKMWFNPSNDWITHT